MALAIRANIPDCRQTNAKYFPEYEKHDYPKVMLNKFGEPICDNPVYLMTTPRDGYGEEPVRVQRNGRPVIIGGEFAIVHSLDEEQEFLDAHPEAAKSVVVEFEPNTKRIADLEAENAQMKKLLAERSKLQGLLADAPPKAKRGRPPKAKAAPVAQSFEEFTGEAAKE